MTDKVIYLLRHGQTVWNRQRRMQGRLDSPLTWRGVTQAVAMGDRLRAALEGEADRFELLSSPLGRSWQTAVIVAERLDRDPGEIVRVEALAEMTWGRWDGLTAAEITARDPELWQARIDDRFTVPPPGGGETQTDVIVRAKAWLDGLAAGARVVAVAHGAFGRALRVAWDSAPHQRMLELDEPQDAFFRLSDAGIERMDAQ